jgi:hypothetical protein
MCLGPKTLNHLCQHPFFVFFVLPGTSAEIAAQSSALCFSTASFNLPSSSFFHFFTHTCDRLVALGFQCTTPSIQTLCFRSTRNHRGNISPINAIVLLYCIRQRDVFVCCPITRTCDRPVFLGVQDIVPPIIALFFSFEPEPVRQFLPSPCHCASLLLPSACCLRLLSIHPYRYAGSSCRSWSPIHIAIYYDNVALMTDDFDPEVCCFRRRPELDPGEHEKPWSSYRAVSLFGTRYKRDIQLSFLRP